MSNFFPAASPPAPKRPWRRAAVFAVGLGLLWLLLQVLPQTPPPTDPAIFSDGAGTVATQPPSAGLTSDRSLITPGYLIALALLAGGGLFAWHLRKRTAAPAGPAQQLQLLGQLAMGPNQQLRLVACGDDVLLLGVTASQISLLKTFPADAFEPAPAPAQPNPARVAPLRRVVTPQPDRSDRSFDEILRSMAPTPSP